MRLRNVCVAAGLLLAAQAANGNTVTISAVADLQGRAFFRSDVRAFNRSYTDALSVTAFYFCSSAPCGSSPQTFSIPPRQSVAYDDIAVSLFAKPNSQGAVVFQADKDELTATSRLYSVASSGDFAGGSFGQFVPGLEDEDAYATSVLTSLRNSHDSHTGFRTHLTGFNPSSSVPAHVKFLLFDGSGAALGQFSLTVGPLSFLPAIAIFDLAGAGSTDTDNAYCVVTADTKLFVAASVLDNISQDTIFVKGESDDAAPSANPLAADFTFSPAQPETGAAVTFTDASTGSPTSWSWTFGDQSAADTTQNPLHTFNQAGVFSVTLTASNNGGSALKTKQVTVTAAGQPPVANFTFLPSSPTAGQSVQFTDTSTQAPTSWAWSFGDPGSGSSNSSTSKNPSHAYAASGDYLVSLTASNSIGPSGPATKTVHVGAAPPAPTANFTFSPSNPTTSTSVQFTDTSTQSPTSWAWNFGDPGSGGSNTSTAKNPTHTFSTTSTFTVSLTASNASGPSSPATKMVTVSSGPPVPTANFTVSPSFPTTSTSVQFTDTSTGSPTSWAWSFGDPGSGGSNTSTAQSPTHTFSTTGTFTVSLTASNASGPSTPKTKNVVVGAPPTADFTFAPPSPAATTTVNFTDTSTGTPTSWSWNFGDPSSGSSNSSTSKNPSHVFATADTYTVTLTSTNAFGSSTPVMHSVVVGPAPTVETLVINVGSYGYNGCLPIVVHVGHTYQIQFHALDNGHATIPSGHGFTGVASLGLSEHHGITTAADYTTEVFTPTSTGTFNFKCSATPDCGMNSTTICAGHTGHHTMTGSIEVDP